MVDQKDAYSRIRDAIKEWGGDLSKRDRQVLISLLAEDFDTLFPKRKRGIREASANEEWRDWAAKNSIVNRLDGAIAHISWLLWKHVGLEPSGKSNSWAAAVSDLIEAAAGAEHPDKLIEKAIKRGHQARIASGITLKGPRSFVGFVRSLRSEREMEARTRQPRLIDLEEDTDGITDIDL